MAALPPRDAGQTELQAHLSGIDSLHGLPAALDGLFEWEMAAGYFAQGIFEANRMLKFPDTQSPVVFRTQINYSRLAYQLPAQAKAAGCPICFDQVASEAKPLLRVYEFKLGSQPMDFFIQLTPFPLRRGHYILIQKEHSPMRIGARAADELLDFVTRAPAFTACSNSDVRDAGVSILDHHHYQVFDDCPLPVMDAQALPGLVATCADGEMQLLDYPLTTMRVRGSRDHVLAASSALIDAWKSEAPGANTCNLTAQRVGAAYETYLFFRNPAFLTPPDLLRIKSEGVGVVETSGEGIYPPPVDDAGVEEIQRDGLTILRRILGGLDPIAGQDRPAFFERMRKAVAQAT
jgi:UDPglucose--hexose-1-phosphate uridylyltransferase